MKRMGFSLRQPRMRKQSQYLEEVSRLMSVLPSISMVRGVVAVRVAAATLPPGKQLSMRMELGRLRYARLGCHTGYLWSLQACALIDFEMINKLINPHTNKSILPPHPHSHIIYHHSHPPPTSLYNLNTPMISKKPIRQLQIKKPIAVSRLIKCYLCNNHFQTQKQFDLHQQQHQNKLAKNTIDDIQRKTQQSFRSKKSVTNFNKTQNISQHTAQSSMFLTQNRTELADREDDFDETEQREIEQALKQSQILLQKMEMVSQLPQPSSEDTHPPQQEEELEEISRWIRGQRQLYTLLSTPEHKNSIEKLILETDFEEKYLENYQQQLLQLRLLANVAIKQESVVKIVQLRRNICRDIFQQLTTHFREQQVKPATTHKRQMQQARLGDNQGEIRNCADCFGSIGGTEQYYSLSCGHCYHTDCWNGQCCG